MSATICTSEVVGNYTDCDIDRARFCSGSRSIRSHSFTRVLLTKSRQKCGRNHTKVSRFAGSSKCMACIMEAHIKSGLASLRDETVLECELEEAMKSLAEPRPLSCQPCGSHLRHPHVFCQNTEGEDDNHPRAKGLAAQTLDKRAGGTRCQALSFDRPSTRDLTLGVNEKKWQACDSTDIQRPSQSAWTHDLRVRCFAHGSYLCRLLYVRGWSAKSNHSRIV